MTSPPNVRVVCEDCGHGGAGPYPPYVCDKCGGQMTTEAAKQTRVIVVGSPTGRLAQRHPEWQHLKLSDKIAGTKVETVIVDDPAAESSSSNPHWPEEFPLIDTDYSEIERRFLGLYSGAVELTEAMKQFGKSLETASEKLSGVELKSAMHPLFEVTPEMLMTKHERQHANHPTEKNPNHPRFQHQPHRPRKRK